MFGEINGVAALLKDYAPCAEFIHCVAHRIALASKHALASEGAEVEAALEEVLPKLYNITNKSDTRSDKQAKYQDEFGEPHNGFIKSGDTRWLSRQQAAARALEQIHSTIGLVDDLSGERGCSTDMAFLHEKMHELDTVALIHILPGILLLPANLCKTFQLKDICVSRASVLCDEHGAGNG